MKPEDVKKAETYVRRVVQFQRSDGCFEFPTQDNAKKCLCPEVFSIVNDLLAEVSFNMAVTMALVGLLEERFQQCKDLWLLVVEKAKNYVRSQGNYFGIGGNFSRMERAGRLAGKIQKLPLDERDETSAEDERVVLETVLY
jgi:hypothetical protein